MARSVLTTPRWLFGAVLAIGGAWLVRHPMWIPWPTFPGLVGTVLLTAGFVLLVLRARGGDTPAA